MAGSNVSDYKIKKLEKGPLQRFKNQNLLIKKFGEIGIQVYKAITGKRTTSELKKDLGLDPSMFDQIITYMQNAGMIELVPAGMAIANEPKQKEDIKSIEPEEPSQPDDQDSEKVSDLEDLSNDDTPSEDTEPLEEKPQEDASVDFDDIQPISIDEEEDTKPDPDTTETVKSKDTKAKDTDEEIQLESKDEKNTDKENQDEKEPLDVADTHTSDSKSTEPDENSDIDSSDISAFVEDNNTDSASSSDSDLSPVEKIISDKYGDIGLQIYFLIDGQRTAEEIMNETGLNETKLVEILDFMDEQGIIKLDYPKGKKKPAQSVSPSFSSSYSSGSPPPLPPRGRTTKSDTTFTPMLEDDDRLDQVRPGPSPVELPVRAPTDIVKSVQMKAKIMLKYGDKGSKVFDLIDGKNDVLDISIKTDMSLYKIIEILNYMMENALILMKPLSRTDVRSKYGDDGYAVYKRYGKEGLMLYELIGKEMSIQQMADKITKDKSTIIDMFVFIHQVLGIELPIDRDVLAKQLGL